MKTKSRIFKARISIQENGEIKVMSYSNRLIPGKILNWLNKKVHEAATEWNGERNWMKEYVEFKHNGVSYRQIDAKSLCNGWCFRNYIGKGCLHPFFSTKPNCKGKIYMVKEKKENKWNLLLIYKDYDWKWIPKSKEVFIYG